MMSSFLNKEFTYAIVGASNNKEKYGYVVLAHLNNAGYKVTPINPSEESVLNLPCFPSIKDAPGPIDVVVFVVPPQVTEQVLKDVKDLGIKMVWMQPGSENDAAIAFCEAHNIECVARSCIMLA